MNGSSGLPHFVRAANELARSVCPKATSAFGDILQERGSTPYAKSLSPSFLSGCRGFASIAHFATEYLSISTELDEQILRCFRMEKCDVVTSGSEARLSIYRDYALRLKRAELR